MFIFRWLAFPFVWLFRKLRALGGWLRLKFYWLLGKLSPLFKLVNFFLIIGAAALLSLFWVHNKHPVPLHLWPFTDTEYAIDGAATLEAACNGAGCVSLGALVMLVAVAFFLLGLITTLLVATRWKAVAVQHEKEIKAWKADKIATRQAEIEAMALTGIETGKGRNLAISQQ